MYPFSRQPTETTPLFRPQQNPPAGFIQTLSGLFGASSPEPATGRQASAIQRNDQWLQALGADTESRAIASQHGDLQRAISTLLDTQPAVVALHTVDGHATCVFVEPGPTRATLERLVSIAEALLKLDNPVAVRLLAAACAAAQQGFPDLEVELLRGTGRALLSSKAVLPFPTLQALCLRAAELIDLAFMPKEDGLPFEAAACRSPEPECAAYGLKLALRRIGSDLKALSARPAQERPVDAMSSLGREIDKLHHQCCGLDQPASAQAAIQLLKDLVALAHGSPVHATLSTPLDRLIDTQERFFGAPLGVAAWYPGLLEGGDPRQAAQAYQSRNTRDDPAVHHHQLCQCLSARVQHGPDRPWSTWAAHLAFAAQAFPQQHDARVDVALCLDWVCARPGAAAERLDSLWACMDAAPEPHKTLRLKDSERLLQLMLNLPAEASIRAFHAYMARVHPKLKTRLEPLRALLGAHQALSAGTAAPKAILERLVDSLSQGQHRMAPIPEWDFLVRRFLGRLLSRDGSIDMANAPALHRLLLHHAVASKDPLVALDSRIDLMRTLWQSVPAAPAPSGAGTDNPPGFCTVLRTHLQHRFGFGGQDPNQASGEKRHAEQLMDACLGAHEASPHPAPQAPAVASTEAQFPQVYASLVRARLAQRAPGDSAGEPVRQTVELHEATLKNKLYLQMLDRSDPAWHDYGARLQLMVQAVQDAQAQGQR